MSELKWVPLDFDDRYHLDTAKNAITSVSQVIEEIVSNEDEAISLRARRDGQDDTGQIRVEYDSTSRCLVVTGDGEGMTAARMQERLGVLGGPAEVGARRGFFHRGVREVFIAMGTAEITSIGRTADGSDVLSTVRFKDAAMAFVRRDDRPTADDRRRLGLSATGTRVAVPVALLAAERPRDFEYPGLAHQIECCVGLRPTLINESRSVWLVYDQAPARLMRFRYPEHETLLPEHEIEVDGLHGTLWAGMTREPVRAGASRRRTRVSGILVRGERAAYEISLGNALRSEPGMRSIVGELRLDGIEQRQRDAAAHGDRDAPFLYKPDRSGLNSDHPLTEKIEALLDAKLGSLVARIPTTESAPVSHDVRRQLSKLAREINNVVKEDLPDGDGGELPRRRRRTRPPQDDEQDRVSEEDVEEDEDETAEREPRSVIGGIAFASSKVLLPAGESREVDVWIDCGSIPVGSELAFERGRGGIVHSGELAERHVPEPDSDGIAQLKLTIRAGTEEGRQEVAVSAGRFRAILPVHVRFQKNGGFVSTIKTVEEDRRLGSAEWDSSSGEVKVFVGRPEFTAIAARARRNGLKDPWKEPLYVQLVIESVREAALWEAAKRKTEIEWDDWSYGDRDGDLAFLNEVRVQYQEFDYKLRARLHRLFASR